MNPLRIFCITTALFFVSKTNGQATYDSITISKSGIAEKWPDGKWADTLKTGRYKDYIFEESTAWKKKTNADTAYLFKLLREIKLNGTEDVSKCFIPRHSMNFYKGGKIVRYMLICFECDGIRFSEESSGSPVKKAAKREAQMKELRLLYTDKMKPGD